MSDRRLGVITLGLQPYQLVLELQRSLREQRADGAIPHDILILAEHPPVYTLGRRTQSSSLPVSVDFLRSRGAEVFEIERGGDVTWHGPGQLVGYPIFHLEQLHRTDLHWYVRSLERALIATMENEGLTCGTKPGKTGVWSGERKIASIGVHVRRWVTMHGFALNVNPDLSWFDWVVPCGLPGVEMTSVARELGMVPDRKDRVARNTAQQLAKEFELEPFDFMLADPMSGNLIGAGACDSASDWPPLSYG